MSESLGILIPNSVEFGVQAGIYDIHRKLIESSLTLRAAPYEAIRSPSYPALADITDLNIETMDESVIFVGFIHGHYGHMITEGISRFWYLFDRQEIKNRKVVYVKDGFSAHSNARFNELLSLMGINEENILNVERPTQFSRIDIPEPSIRFYDYFHSMYHKTVENIVADSNRRLPPSKSGYVYLSKLASKNGRGYNSEDIETTLKLNGVATLNAEAISLVELISVLQGAHTLLASSGSASHNSVFLRPGSRLVCLNRSHHIHPIQTMINIMKGLNCNYVDVYLFSTESNFGDLPCFNYVSSRFRRWLSNEGFIGNSRKRTVFLIASFLRFSIDTCRVIVRRIAQHR